MRIYAFVTSYPSAYKPYYDTQFADFIRKGHDLRIFAMVGSLDTIVDEKVLEWGLDRRTSYLLPASGSALPRFIPKLAAAIARAPALRIRRMGQLLHDSIPLRRKVGHMARMLTLPTAPPDLCLVNGHRTMTYVPWLRRMYPGVPVALYYYGGEPAEAGALSEQVTRLAFSCADLVFTLTDFAKEEAVTRGCDPEIIAILPIGFELDDYRPARPRLYRPNGVLRLLSASRLSEGKGHIYALAALRQLVDRGVTKLHYSIIGDGPMRESLERYVANEGLTSYVTFAGALSNREVIPRLSQADAVILPSISVGNWTETQGAILQEALLMEALVVTTRTGGVPESIPRAMDEFSVEPCDAKALAAVLEKVYRLPDAELRRLGHFGSEWAAQNYSIESLNARLLQRVHDERNARTGRIAFSVKQLGT